MGGLFDESGLIVTEGAGCDREVTVGVVDCLDAMVREYEAVAAWIDAANREELSVGRGCSSDMGSPTFSSPSERSQRLKTLCQILLFNQGLSGASCLKAVAITRSVEKHEVCLRVYVMYRTLEY